MILFIQNSKSTLNNLIHGMIIIYSGVGIFIFKTFIFDKICCMV